MIHSYLKHRWHAEGGYREFLALALPLILSTASWSVQHFVDRVFLTWHSTEALAAALPAGMTHFIFAGLFMGIAQYINTFVAQYSGARRPHRVGPAVWQGAYLSLVAVVASVALAAAAPFIFDLVGHEPTIRQHETAYFSILCWGLGPLVFSTAFSCFFSGRGQTWTVLAVNGAATGVNIVFDYGLIFGAWGLPALGIRGAAWATNMAGLFSALAFLLLFLQPQYRQRYATGRGWRFDPQLFGRLWRYGGPSGLNFMLDVLSYSFFVLLVGRLGTIELAATNLTFNINSLAFMPLIGCGIAVSTLVGQRLGDDRPKAAEYCTWSAVHLGLAYMGVMTLAYLFLPDLFLSPFGLRAQGPDFEAARALAAVLLRFVAVYLLFEGLYMVFTAALKGAGDTRFVMYVSIGLAWVLMIAPSLLSLYFGAASIYLIWGFMCAYIIASGIVFYLRFRQGKWKGMRVIEAQSKEEAK